MTCFLSQMVYISSNKSEQLEKKPQNNKHIFAFFTTTHLHLESRLINSYNSCFLPGECAARSDQNKETKNIHLECSLIPTTPAQIVPAQCHNSCVPFAEHTADGKTETGVAWTENHPLYLVCGCVLISSKRVFWMLPSLLSLARTFQWSFTCSEAGCHSSGCSQVCLPSSCWLIALELVSDTCQGKVPLHSAGSEYLISPVSKSS